MEQPIRQRTQRIHLEIDEQTITSLREQGMKLYGFKGLLSTSPGLMVVTAYMAEVITGPKTNLVLEPEYLGYIAAGPLPPGTVVAPSATYEAEEGATLDIDASGQGTESPGGIEGVYGFKNTSPESWDVGLVQKAIDGGPIPICAATLPANFVIGMVSGPVVLLTFSDESIVPGEVVETAKNQSILIASADDRPISISYNADSLWKTGGNPAAKILPPGFDLRMLIQPPPSAKNSAVTGAQPYSQNWNIEPFLRLLD